MRFHFFSLFSEYPESKWAMDGGVSGRSLGEIKFAQPTHYLHQLSDCFLFGSVDPMRVLNRLNNTVGWIICDESLEMKMGLVKFNVVKCIFVTSSWIIIAGRKIFFHCLHHWKYLILPAKNDEIVIFGQCIFEKNHQFGFSMLVTSFGSVRNVGRSCRGMPLYVINTFWLTHVAKSTLHRWTETNKLNFWSHLW